MRKELIITKAANEKCRLGTNTLLLRGNMEREAKRHFGSAGRTHAAPYCRKGTENKTGLS